MLRTVCLITLLAGSTIAQAQSDQNPVAHRGFWLSSNDNPVLDSFGNCVRTGSWESLGEPKCYPEVAEAVVEETTPVAVASVETAAVIVPEPTIVVTYSYPIEIITANVYFDFDKNNLRVDQQESIELAIMDARKAHKIFSINLDGYSDSLGTQEYNYGLSQSRINTVANYLNLRGIQANSTMAWGEQQLVLNADGSENDELSRRVTMVFKVQQKVAD